MSFRRNLRVLILASLLGAPGLAVHAADAPAKPAPPPASPAPAQTPPAAPVDATAPFYPAAARAAGVEGQAIINCSRDAHLKLIGCTLVSEQPAGQGFGQAALAMAATSPENPKVTTEEANLRGPTNLQVTFSLHPSGPIPTALSPDLTQPAHVMTSAQLVTGPTVAQVQAAYPPRALEDQVEGVALLGCFVGKDGRLSACSVIGEDPGGYGFGQAALDLVGDYKLTPRLMDGDPMERAEVRVPVEFQRDPAAPLTLQVAPPADHETHNTPLGGKGSLGDPSGYGNMDHLPGQ